MGKGLKSNLVGSLGVTVPTSCIGRLFGKGGKTIRRIQEKHGVHIHIPNTPSKPSVVQTIRGAIGSSLREAEREIQSIVRGLREELSAS